MTGETNQHTDKKPCLNSRIENDSELRSVLVKYFELSDAKKKHVLELICFLSEGSK